MASLSELASEVTGTSRVNKRNHGMRLAAPIANEREGQDVVDACVARSATKIMVGGRAVFAEYPSQINYMRGVGEGLRGVLWIFSAKSARCTVKMVGEEWEVRG